VIAIVDYGMGNLKSVANAFEALGRRCVVTADPADLRGADAIVLPGVGAFGDGIANLNAARLAEVLTEEVTAKGKPFLGICLGMQLLATRGEEFGSHTGLGWIGGCVRRLEPREAHCKVPHMGWNSVRIHHGDPLYEGLGSEPVFYFVHSYHFEAQDKDVVSATCWHGQEVTASLHQRNVFAVQYHPEKSQRAGLKVLENFCAYAAC
jgi:glutamine amidotransferase